MVAGWDWIEEGERISAESRRIAGLTEEVRAESIVFNCQAADEEEATLRSEPWAVERENSRLRAENLRLRAEIVRLREAQPKSVAALREALVLLGEGV